MEHTHDTSGNTIYGFWVYLMTDFILFATLFATYAVLATPVPKELFNLSFVMQETLVLLISCFTCGMAMVYFSKQNRTKTLICFGLTFLLGLLFLGMVWHEIMTQARLGNVWQKNGFLSAYFTLIGTHALHILFALLFIPIFSMQLRYWGFTDMVERRFTCLSLFWFFSYLVWALMFTFVYLIGLA
jgi:cytochrome o ubiquinol oxidase subunit 3